MREAFAAAVATGLLVTGLLTTTVAAPTLEAGTGRAPAPADRLRLTRTLSLPQGDRVACAVPADCRLWASALQDAAAALDPVLPAGPLGAVTLVAPTAAGQAAVLGTGPGTRPAATTLRVDARMVARGAAPASQRGRTWIVVNPEVARTGGDLPRQVLVHELVHVRTLAPDLPGPLWVEEGYAVALTHRVLGPTVGPVVPASSVGAAEAAVDAALGRSAPVAGGPSGWPSDDWVPLTIDDYGVAGRIVEGLAARLGWDRVARWYAASEAGAGSLAAARAQLSGRTVIAELR
ncbi:hypothetical protein [Raineyella fluvialis]|uniref:Peptidase MA superfamily protein n=1 Tax=Raineyella fluvialis TaxID=2662261 RepID=A0A5Q2FCV2_9ACTN|nr:hypothetical protein [Raineyella fluvialis]QGF24211.1 hypothetical protein Rai3103_11620 [Raineyella fluvialis]